ncbi:MAG: hypothetical protein QM820_12815 [Minicystis sp.]
MCSRETGCPPLLHTVRRWMRPPSSSCSSWKRTLFFATARWIAMGMLTRPKPSVPL